MSLRLPSLGTWIALAVLAGCVFALLHPAPPSDTARAPTQFATPTERTGAQENARVAESQSWGSRIAAGHAFTKHGPAFGFSTRAELAAHIDRIISKQRPERSHRGDRGMGIRHPHGRLPGAGPGTARRPSPPATAGTGLNLERAVEQAQVQVAVHTCVADRGRTGRA